MTVVLALLTLQAAVLPADETVGRDAAIVIVVALLFGCLYACLPAAAWRAPAAVVLTLLLGNSGQSGWLLAVALAAAAGIAVEDTAGGARWSLAREPE